MRRKKTRRRVRDTDAPVSVEGEEMAESEKDAQGGEKRGSNRTGSERGDGGICGRARARSHLIWTEDRPVTYARADSLSWTGLYAVPEYSPEPKRLRHEY